MPQRWTEIHPDWDKNWRLPLSFHRTAVEKDDIARLDEGQCLNDNIIGFYLKYLQVQAEQQRPETSKRIYFHNSFFYSKLKPTSGRQINFDGVKNWTAKVDIFSYDYIIVPVNEHFHWWVAIICNPGKLDSTVAENAVGSPDSNDDLEEVMAVSSTADAVARSPQRDNSVVVVQDRRPVSEDKEDVRHREDSFKIPVSGDEGDIKTTQLDKGSEVAMVVGDDAATAPAKSSAPQRGRKRGRKSVGGAQRKYNPAEPRIITLDSLGASHSPVCTHLKQYLIAEFKDKKGKDVEYNQSSIGMRATNIPEQDNFCDCGVYLLKYVAEFLGEPDKFIQSILLREGREWDFDASKMRDGIRQLIFDLHEPYQKEQEDAKRQKAQAKRRREQSKSEGPPDDSGPSALHASAERAVSPQKVGGSTPSVSVRASPVVEHPPTPRLPAATTPEIVTIEQARSSLKAQQKGPSESAQQPGNRSVLVVDIKAGKPGAAKVATPQLQPSAVQASHALPSIEIPDDDEVPPESPHQTQPVSRGTSLSVGALSVVEETDDKVVLIRPQTTASEHKPHSSVSQNELGSEGFYRAADDGNSKESTKPTSPVKKAMVSSTRASWGGPPEESPYFGRTPYNRDQPSRPRKTYKGSRKTSSGGTIDLTDD
jgi:sentrin-specific protease 7